MIGRPMWAAFTLVSKSEPFSDEMPFSAESLSGTVHVRVGESFAMGAMPAMTRLRCGREMKSENVANEVHAVREDAKFITCKRCAEWARRALNGEFR
jgi:hypothetical protein